ENLDMDAGSYAAYDGILIEGVIAQDDRPVVLSGCTIRRSSIALSVRGCSANYNTVMPCRAIVVRDNLIVDAAAIGMKIYGELHAVHVVGNRIIGPTRYAAI